MWPDEISAPSLKMNVLPHPLKVGVTNCSCALQSHLAETKLLDGADIKQVVQTHPCLQLNRLLIRVGAVNERVIK